MRFTKPEWVMHYDGGSRSENPKRVSIFSAHVHPDGSRIATGGLDAKVRIWSTKPILNQASEMSNRPPKSLCTLTLHTGPVLTVRWAHSGRWLASGSDDEIVMIWDLDPHGAGRVWGSDEVNVEGWKPLKRLPGHESDVTDVAWAPQDRYLASVGLDSKVLIWCGYTLERLHKLDLHQGFVKGVTWDPVGEFLATQSDDKTVKIWRTTDWQQEAEITKPFEDSPGSTFFRRLSWSPDGAHITASNAMNNKAVFVAAVIARNSWTSEISLVGHENTVEVAAYNPHIFLRNTYMPVVASNICSVVALGADDYSVSVWQTKSARPLIVAKDCFERQIMDLSWSVDGLALYAVSSDGTMGVFNFDPDELEGIAPPEAQAQYLSKFSFVPSAVPVGFSHAPPPTIPNGSTNFERSTPPPTPPPASAHLQPNGFENTSSGEIVNVLIAKRGNKNKKRIHPTFHSSVNGMGGPGSIPSASTGPSSYTTTTFDAPPSSSAARSHAARPMLLAEGWATNGSNSAMQISNLTNSHPSQRYDTAQLSSQSNLSGSRIAPSFSSSSFDETAEQDIEMGGAMVMDVPINSLDTNNMKGRSRTSEVFGEDPRPPKARTLGGDRVREGPNAAAEAREIRERAGPSNWMIGEGMGDLRLVAPSLKTFLECKIEDTQDALEGMNSENGDVPSEVTFFSNKTVQWLDYLPSPALSLVATTRFCAVGMEDGSINVYSLTGRRIMPTLCLGVPCSFFEGAKNYLMAITLTGQLHVWNVKQQQATMAPVSIVQILNASPNVQIVSASIRPNGAPLLHLSSGIALSYDSTLFSWIKVSESWWAQGSTHWKGRQRGNNGNDARGVVAAVEGRITERMTDDGTAADKQRPNWWTVAMTLGHLETRLHAAKILDSSAEYKQALLLYAKTIADEGFRGKAEELLKELFGPIYWRPNRNDDNWSSTVVGFSKRDLLKEVISIFARSKTLFKLASEYQEMLKKCNSDD